MSTTISNSDEQMLIDLERSLLEPSVRSDQQRLDQLLHDQFEEIGYSGLHYSKADVLDRLPHESAEPYGSITRDFDLTVLSADAVQLIYRHALISEDGELTRYASRTSIWVRSEFGWQLRFHHGTPVPPFEPDPWEAPYGPENGSGRP